MSHPIFRIISFEQTGAYALRLRFDDGLSRTIDFERELPRQPTGKLYKRLLRDRYWAEHESRIV